MGLPQIPIESTVVEVAGAEFKIHALTGTEWNHCMSIHQSGKTRDARLRLIAYGTDNELDDVKAWVDTVPGGVLEDLAFHIEKITGCGPDAQFRRGTGPDAGRDGPV